MPVFACLAALAFASPQQPPARPATARPLRTFSAAGKERPLLEAGKEVEIFRRSGRGCITHMWFALDERVRLRVYVDGEAKPSIDAALDVAHGYAFGGSPEPWGTSRMGRYGAQFNNHPLPYGRGIRIALLPTTRVFDGVTGRKTWWIIRGAEGLPAVVGGRRLPPAARLRLYRLEDYTARPLEEFTACAIRGKGMLYLTTVAAQGERRSPEGNELAYMEGCVRAYIDGADTPQPLSSGLEDYFLGSGYFHQNQRYYGEVAGLTYIDKATSAFSAYRFHETDPVYFQKGLRLTLRCGDTVDGRPVGDPRPTRYTVYVWAYVW